MHRILWREYADHTNAAGELHRLDEIVHGQIGNLLSGGIMALIADALAADISTPPMGQVHDAIDRIALRIVDGDRAY